MQALHLGSITNERASGTRKETNCCRFTRRSSLRFAWCHTTLYNMVNLHLRDVILVNLGFHMCSQCLSMLIPFSHTTNTIYLDLANCHRANRPDTKETPLGASSISCVFSHSLLRSPLTIEVLFTGYSHCRSHNNHRLTRLNLKTEEICWGGSTLEESSTWLRRLFQQHLECYKINCIRTQGQYHASAHHRIQTRHSMPCGSYI